MLTLMHEDIYVYIDEIKWSNDAKEGKEIEFIHDKSVSNRLGVLDIEIAEGEFDSLTVSTDVGSATLSKEMKSGDEIILDFYNASFRLNSQVIFMNSLLEVDKSEQPITLSFTGEGNAVVFYRQLFAPRNDNDLLFCESLNITTAHVISNRVDIKGNVTNRYAHLESHDWSLGGMWNSDEIQKFHTETGLFNLRFIDEMGNELYTLKRCIINNYGRESSESSDFNFSVSGVCKEII